MNIILCSLNKNCVQGNGNALAMVTAIIDGTGSLGACITGVAITWLSNKFDTDGCGGGGDGSTGGYDELGADFDARLDQLPPTNLE